MQSYAKLTPTEVYESIATCGRVLIYRLSPASSRVKFLNFWREIQIFFFCYCHLHLRIWLRCLARVTAYMRGGEFNVCGPFIAFHSLTMRISAKEGPNTRTGQIRGQSLIIF